MNRKGKNNSNYKSGETLKKHYCNCGNEICFNNWKYGSKSCVFCAYDKDKNGRYKNGLPHCIDCGKNLKEYTTVRCRQCWKKYRKSQSIKNKLKINSCKDCKSPIGKKSLRCVSCHNKNKMKVLMKNPKFMISLIKNSLKSQSRKQSHPEKLISYLLPTDFTYTGKSDFMIGRFNPDFVDVKRKLIIEMFGDYWHNLPNYKKRDRIKLKLYKKLGYKVLVVWAKELKNQDKLQKKLLKFL